MPPKIKDAGSCNTVDAVDAKGMQKECNFAP